MKILVMGGTSFNGLSLVWELARVGHDVTICNRGKTEARIPVGVDRITVDRTDHDAMRSALGGKEWDAVYDISGYTLPDVELMVDLLRGRCGHYIFASSTVTYATQRGGPIAEGWPDDRSAAQNAYALNKLACEDHLREQHRRDDFPYTVAAFSMVFGPNNIIPDREQRMFVRLLKGRKILIPGDGTTMGQVGHVDDQSRALRMMLGQPVTIGKRYNVTGADYFTDEGYVDTFARVVGVEPEKVFIPAPTMDDLWDGKIEVADQMSKWNINTRSGGGSDTQNEAMARAMRLFQLATLVQKIQPNIHRWNTSTLFSVEALRRDLGWEPTYTFQAAVEQTYDWFRREGLHETKDFDFTFEDQLLERLGA